MLLAEVFDKAGVPNGVFNVVNGYGPTVGAALSEHPDERPAVTTFADAPISVPFPPRQAPNARAQITGSSAMLRSDAN